jgi:hypothetical protein
MQNAWFTRVQTGSLSPARHGDGFVYVARQSDAAAAPQAARHGGLDGRAGAGSWRVMA